MWGVDLLIQFLSLWVGSFSALLLLLHITSTNESRPTSRLSPSDYPPLKMPRTRTPERSPSTLNGFQGVVVVNGQLKRHV